MQNRTRYLFDSDVLISSARLYYAPAYCQAFWDWLTAGHEAGLFYSIDKVKSELLNGDEDPLHKWALTDSLSDFFQKSLPALAQWPRITEFASCPEKNFTEAAKTKFLDVNKADAWLIAYAAHHGNYVIVTNEVPAPYSKHSIKLPDAAEQLAVKTAKLHQICNIYAGHNFSLKAVETAISHPNL